MTAELVPLSPEVARVAASVAFDETEQQFAIPGAAMTDFGGAFARARTADERQQIGEHLLALIIKYERVDKTLTRRAVAQLTVLLLLATHDPQDARTRLREAAVSLDEKTKALLVMETNKLPAASAGKIKGAFSLLGLRLNKPH